MKKLLPTLTLLGAVLLATPAVAGTRAPKARTAISSQEAASLRSIDAGDAGHAGDAGDLGGLRAGVSPAQRSISPVEHAALATASARDAGDLGALRGGDITLTDRDVQIIVIVAVVVLILILI